MQVLAPAKINVWLRVLRRRSDGFHEIETLIAPISLCDEIQIESCSGKKAIEFQCDDPSVPKGDENLAVRAATLFFEKTNIDGGISIELKKKIPHGAGLGGGSSDAASTLLALNDLFDTKLPLQTLSKMAEAIGSDVPCEIPGVSYAAQKFAGQTFANDLERPVFEKFIFLAEMKAWLLKRSEVGAALMSGSVSTIFAVMQEGADCDLLVKRAKAELDPELWTCVCKTL